MDTKALAKSKRAHSLHHSKKHHPHQTSKTTSVSSGATSGGKKQTGKQVTEKPQQSQGSRTLPSNWDRYEEEFVLDSEDIAKGSSSLATDDVRKSKGANYAHLISEAKAQFQGNSSSDIFYSFNDVLDDFMQGLGPLLSARGQSILSWIAEDNFKLEDISTTSHEAPFLSLNLHTLAEQLAKAKLSDRLFIAPDILPPELFFISAKPMFYAYVDEFQAWSGDKHDGTPPAEVDYVPSLSLEPEENICRQQKCAISSATTIGSLHAPTSTDDGLKHQIEDELDQRSLPKSLSNVNVDSTAKKPARFEAANAEAELDMLLNSFDESKCFESSSASKMPNNLSSSLQEDTPATFVEENLFIRLAPAESGNKGHDVMEHSKIPTNVDDTIDNLLEETSSVINVEVKAAPHNPNSSSNPISKSKLLDDFDSWLDTI